MKLLSSNVQSHCIQRTRNWTLIMRYGKNSLWEVVILAYNEKSFEVANVLDIVT